MVTILPQSASPTGHGAISTTRPYAPYPKLKFYQTLSIPPSCIAIRPPTRHLRMVRRICTRWLWTGLLKQLFLMFSFIVGWSEVKHSLVFYSICLSPVGARKWVEIDIIERLARTTVPSSMPCSSYSAITIPFPSALLWYTQFVPSTIVFFSVLLTATITWRLKRRHMFSVHQREGATSPPWSLVP